MQIIHRSLNLFTPFICLALEYCGLRIARRGFARNLYGIYARFLSRLSGLADAAFAEDRQPLYIGQAIIRTSAMDMCYMEYHTIVVQALVEEIVIRI